MAKKKVTKKSSAAAEREEEAQSTEPAEPTETKEERKARRQKEREERKKNGKGGRRKDGKNLIVFFMGALIQGGYYNGGKLATDNGPMGKAAQVLRQNAEKLARQTRKFGDGDIELGGGETPDSEGGEDGEE